VKDPQPQPQPQRAPQPPPPLPMAPASCSLDADGLSAQLARYGAAGARASILIHEPRRLVVRLATGIHAAGVVEQAIAVERECCPFFTLGWCPETRELSVGVADAEHEPALAAIAYALGLADSPGTPGTPGGASAPGGASTPAVAARRASPPSAPASDRGSP
jgi:hypothetical protein